MKKSLILCCVTCCLLSAFPGNLGSKLTDSLYCVLQYSKDIVTCSWSESRISRHYVNMSLMERDNPTGMCEMELVKLTPTHLNWTCHTNISFRGLYHEIHFIFVPDRSLESRLNVSNEGDEAKPKNLHCEMFDDGMTTCSWEVRQAVADSVDFTLYYQNRSKKEEACQPRCWQEVPMYLFCSCNFTAGDPNNPIQLRNISVGPKDAENSFINFYICKNIKLLPRILTVDEKNKGETFEIHWKNLPNEKTEFKYHYELCYWRENDMELNEVAFDCPGDTKTLSPNNDRRVLLTLGKQLKPSSNYSVMVRVRLGEKNPDDCYKGPWSEWSNVQTFHTKSVPNILLLCILVLSGVVVLVICVVYGCRALIRHKKQWDDRIPTPSKSSIIKSIRKTKDRLVIRYLTLQNGPSFPSEEHLYVEPYNKVLMWAPSKKDISLLKPVEEQITRPHSELLRDNDTQCLYLYNIATEDYPTASITDGYKPFSELIDEQENRDMKDSQFTVCAFDGPYLFS
ncbi:uncharacterized protein LOC122927210 isoform X1 [Bufo gargarizans]|uniref:uncharacterized protein LOC122927210 isoform X1 n=2 Tax=Bufo gargarizans TaxID=30331 RepID=UPI001CF5527E|nr:uncharacterized protein LOC122927210 isoform X1 [Bufo gargarizans]XP_044134781.1 uncharacterized protein LOC122927210 isoform X1 [Bufo gargarizans]XP_044134782.1 uncharacterized protein LOC122927210 isoform X1 [Bufo gargarizans]